MSSNSLKSPQTVSQPTSQDRPRSDAELEVTYATVYTFVIYDHDKGGPVIYPRMATRRTIANMRGKVNEDSAWVVDEGQLDVEGFYSGDPPRK